MPYPETCPECGGRFRNSGTHFTTRRSEVGRHVLLELACQSAGRRFWWDFTTGHVTADGKTPANGRAAAQELVGVASANGQANGHAEGLAPGRGEDRAGPAGAADPQPARDAAPRSAERPRGEGRASAPGPAPSHESRGSAELAQLQAAFVRQLQLDRLTLRQMRGWLAGEDARRVAEVSASATEATYERLALSLFGASLPALLGQERAVVPPGAALSAEERLEIQREKARVRARQRRAALKAAKLAG